MQSALRVRNGEVGCLRVCMSIGSEFDLGVRFCFFRFMEGRCASVRVRICSAGYGFRGRQNGPVSILVAIKWKILLKGFKCEGVNV